LTIDFELSTLKKGMDMDIALIGYGSMGREVESAARQRGHHIAAIFTSHSPLPEPNSGFFQTNSIDCCIDVSTASAVRSNTRICSNAGIPIVVGTTGWQNERQEILDLIRNNNGTLIYGNNFSVGAQIFFSIIRTAAQLMNNFTDYDVALHEIHHVKKKDSPSGTALSLAQILVAQLDRKTSVKAPAAGELMPHEIGVSSTRVGNVSGTHSVLFRSPADEIELVHRAHNRSGFAAGAVLAAEMTQRYTGVHVFDELIFQQSFIHHS